MSSVSLPAPGSTWEKTLAAVNRRPIILALLAVLFGAQISAVWYPTPDAVCYLSIARKLAHDHVLANRGNPQLYYPVGYPVLISPLFICADRPFLLLSAMNAVLAIAFLAGVYAWSRRVMPTAAVWLTLLTAVNIEVLAMYRRTLSENVFLLVMIGMVNILSSLGSNEDQCSKGRLILGALLMILLAAIRPAGIMFASGFGLYLAQAAWRGQLRWSQAITRTLLVGVPAAVVLLGLIAYDKAMARSAGTVSYLDQVIDPGQTFVGQLLEGVRLRISDVGRLTVPGMFKAYGSRGDWMNPNMLIYVPLVVLCVIGWVKLLRRGPNVLAWTMPFYVALHTIWPYDQGGRFLLPLLPLILVCLWQALEPVRAYQFRVAALLVVAHLGVSLGYWLMTDLPRAQAEIRRLPAVDHMTEVLRSDPRPAAVSAALGDAWLFLNYTLDRPVSLQPEGTTVPGNVIWLVWPKDAPVCNGFAPVGTWGDCRLLRRIGF